MNPKHLKSEQLPESRTAIAPYNFVELPGKVVEAEPLPNHNCYDSKHHTHTGRIECTLTTSSPLYIRCGLTKEQFEQGKEAKDLPDFFYTDIDSEARKPVIPGSSLRGMLRTMVEIASFGKIERVMDKGLVYRAVGDTTSLGESYRVRLLKAEPAPKTFSFLMQAGYMQETAMGWQIRPAQKSDVDGMTFARIEQAEADALSNIEPWYTAANARRIFVEFAPAENHLHSNGNINLYYAKVTQASNKPDKNLREGVLVRTGGAPKKCMEFVLNLPNNEVKAIPVPDELIQDYKEQITQFQEKFLGRNGVLQENHPVFYIIEEEKIVFFGHAMMFRLPYKLSPIDFVPEALKSPALIAGLFHSK